MTKSQVDDDRILLQTGSDCHHQHCCAAANAENMRDTLNKSTFYGGSAKLCDAGPVKIKDVSRLIFPRKFPGLLNQCFLRWIFAMRRAARPASAGRIIAWMNQSP
jgi:hypothetical protein